MVATALLVTSGTRATAADALLVTHYAQADTRSKAETLWREGLLERVHLFPLAGGGEDIDLNVVYLPKPAALAKAELDERVLKMAGEGHVADYEAAPEYHGDSFVPKRIVVRAMAADGRVVVHETIEVW